MVSGERVWWVDELLEGIEIEHDLDVAQKLTEGVGNRSKSIVEGFRTMVEIVLSQPQCFVM
jgi:hypothetical protein